MRRSESIPDFSVVLVEPKYEGNIGAVARAMKNFGLKNLVLINPPELGAETYKRAMHAADIIENAKVSRVFDDAMKKYDLVVGTSGVTGINDKNYLRLPMEPKEFVERVQEIDGRVALLFGREDFGLLNEELAKCDIVVTIPASEKYSVMNVSHAATIIFYELFQAKTGTKAGTKKPRKASNFEKETMYRFFDRLIDGIDYPEHKKENTKMMFRRLMGRALPSKWEFYIMMGVLSKSLRRMGVKDVRGKNE